ncbi:hypothetical protein ACP4OV_023970 [Aristida adscensionis]
MKLDYKYSSTPKSTVQYTTPGAMVYVLVGDDDSGSEASADDSVVDLPLRSLSFCLGAGGHYRPAAEASAARARLGPLRCGGLRRPGPPWRVPRGPPPPRAAAVARAEPGLLRLRRGRGGARFPEGGLYVCPDLPPLGPALQAAQRAIMQDADHGACDCYLDTLRDVMWLLVGDAGNGRGPAVFDREKLEADFGLQWVDESE